MNTQERIEKMLKKTEPILRAGRVPKPKKLKPCPFCGSTNIETIEICREWSDGWDDYRENYWHVRCNDCDVLVGEFWDVDEAIESWNKRAVKHGAWEQHCMPSPHLECSECGYIVDCSDGSNYCPMCGAKMYKEQNNV